MEKLKNNDEKVKLDSDKDNAESFSLLNRKIIEDIEISCQYFEQRQV